VDVETPPANEWHDLQEKNAGKFVKDLEKQREGLVIYPRR
jgi:hypothetical protein